MGKMEGVPTPLRLPSSATSAASTQTPQRVSRMRYLLLGSALVIAGGAGLLWSWLRPAPPLAQGEEYRDDDAPLPEAEAFVRLLLDHRPVEALEKCLARYQREVRHGMTATLVKRERIYGQPRPPQEPVQEVIDLAVRGDVPDDQGQTHIQVRMIWREGARSVLGSPLRGILYVQSHGPGADRILTYRPQALLRPEHTIAVNDASAKSSSRYCVRDAGVYRGMLRTYNTWKQRQQAGRLHVRYLATEAVEAVGGRICHILERTCPEPEVDPFEIGGAPNIRPGDDPAELGVVRVRVYLDAERWLQLGTELYRADGHLLASYYFRDVNLQPVWNDDEFTPAGLKRRVATQQSAQR
ncbi:MAG: DUF1571 domain-containing protein [Gemmataceae bacterium]|nr:DUF1571 domain-containing protein [Gemmataceae bacterium]